MNQHLLMNALYPSSGGTLFMLPRGWRSVSACWQQDRPRDRQRNMPSNFTSWLRSAGGIESAINAVFFQYLTEGVQKKIACRDDKAFLDSFIDLEI